MSCHKVMTSVGFITNETVIKTPQTQYLDRFLTNSHLKIHYFTDKNVLNSILMRFEIKFFYICIK